MQELNPFERQSLFHKHEMKFWSNRSKFIGVVFVIIFLLLTIF